MSRYTLPSIFRLTVTAVSMTAGVAVAAPPAPPPEYIDALAKRIVPTQTSQTFDDYAGSLAEDLTVSVNGQQMAATKATWIAIERHRLGNVDRRVLCYAEGYDSVLIIDQFDDRTGVRSSFDPRYQTRAVRYQVGSDHLIHAIRIVQVDGFLRTAR